MKILRTKIMLVSLFSFAAITSCDGNKKPDNDPAKGSASRSRSEIVKSKEIVPKTGSDLTFTTSLLDGETMSYSKDSDSDANVFYITVKNISNDEVEITKVNEIINNKDLEFQDRTSLLKYSCEAGTKLSKDKECLLSYAIKSVAGKTEDIVLDEPLVIIYKKTPDAQTYAAEANIKGTVHWLSDADLQKEFKVSVANIGPGKLAKGLKVGQEIGFLVKNEGRFPATFGKNYFFKGAKNFEAKQIDKLKSTCKPKDDWENKFKLAPGADCELWLNVPNLDEEEEVTVSYSLLSASHKVPFTIKIEKI